MNLKFCVGYDEALEKVKSLAKSALDGTDGVVQEPPPRVLVSDLISEGVSLTVNFWINTNEDKPLEVFDRASIAIVETLNKAGIEMVPPGSMIVQRPKDESEEEEPRKKQDF